MLNVFWALAVTVPSAPVPPTPVIGANTTLAATFTVTGTCAPTVVCVVCADAVENAANTSAESAAFINKQHVPTLIPVRTMCLHILILKCR